MKEAIKDFFSIACTVVFGILSVVFLLVVVVLAARILIMLGKGIINTSLCCEFLGALGMLAACIGITRVLVDAGDGVYRTSSNNIGPHGSDKEGSNNEDISDNR